jgi:flagellar protein FliJ
MNVKQTERLLRNREFDLHHCRLRAIQIETMIAEFDRICADLTQQIEGEEARVHIFDQAHFAYPIYAKAARERRERIERSAGALKIELNKLQSKLQDAAYPQVAA